MSSPSSFVPPPASAVKPALFQEPGLPVDDGLCAGDAMDAAQLRRLLQAALPDKSQHKAAGWFGQTDFLLTRSHVDEDQDAYHDALFITLWKRWDFWLALPPAENAPTHALAQAWARLRSGVPPPPPGADGLVRQYRAYDSTGQPGAWQPLPAQAGAGDAAAGALAACGEGWRKVLAYWRLAEGQRRAGRPLRERLHATLTPARIEALTLLPVFTTRYNTWSDPERNGWWEGDVWIGARQPGQQGGHSWGRALKFSWRNGSERAGDPEDDAHACYQIDLTPSDALPEGTAHPNGLRISYSQRQSDPRTPLPNHAVQHMQHLLELFTTLEQRLHAAHAQEQQALHSSGLSGDAPPLPRLPPFAPHEADAEVFGPVLMALSHDWQAHGRAHAARVREHWLKQADAAEAAAALEHGTEPAASSAEAAAAAVAAAAVGDAVPAHGVAPGAAAAGTPPVTVPPPAPVHFMPAQPTDPRGPQAGAVLQLARAVHALADGDLSARFHRRFAFAPHVYAHHAARTGHAVDALQWLEDGRLLARTEPVHPTQAPAWWRVSADAWALSPTAAPANLPASCPAATVHGLRVEGDAQGDLHGLAEDGTALWRHHIGGAILAIAAAPDGHTLAVGSASGYLVLLRKGSGTDPALLSTSRYAELRRFIFWADASSPLAW